MPPGVSGSRFARAYSGRVAERQGNKVRTALASGNPLRLARHWRGRLAALCKLGFKRGDAGLQGLILLARQPRHVLDRLELLALDHVEVAQDAVGLVADHGIELPPHPRGNAGGVVHQPRKLVEEAVAGLGHVAFLGSKALPEQWGRIVTPARPGRAPFAGAAFGC